MEENLETGFMFASKVYLMYFILLNENFPNEKNMKENSKKFISLLIIFNLMHTITFSILFNLS